MGIDTSFVIANLKDRRQWARYHPNAFGRPGDPVAYVFATAEHMRYISFVAGSADELRATWHEIHTLAHDWFSAIIQSQPIIFPNLNCQIACFAAGYLPTVYKTLNFIYYSALDEGDTVRFFLRDAQQRIRKRDSAKKLSSYPNSNDASPRS